MTVSLIGFMGCGKSSVGRKLSSLLCRPFVDLDDEIVARSGMSVLQWFEDKGEQAFREYELQILKLLLKEYGGDIILSVGGGTPVTKEAAQILQKQTHCIYIKASAVQLKKILSVLDNSGRPLLKLHTVEELLSARERIYESTACCSVNLSDFTDGVPDDRVYHDMAMKVKDMLCQ